MRIKITITKDVIERSLMCGVHCDDSISDSCALAIAYNDLIPNVNVGGGHILFWGKDSEELKQVETTNKQYKFIRSFDRLSDNPQQRYSLVGQTFDVEIPDSVIEYWYQDAAIAAQKIADSSCLTLIQDGNDRRK